MVGMITPQKGLHSILEPYANIKKQIIILNNLW